MKLDVMITDASLCAEQSDHVWEVDVVLKCGITGRTSLKKNFHTHVGHFSTQNPDKAV
jgi:hypothetical protein